MDQTCKTIDIINCLEKGQIVSFQTDTVFSLSCDATNNEAVARIYAIKKRLLNKALPIFVESIEQAEQIAVFNETAMILAKRYWPGPLTLVLPLKEESPISPLIYRNHHSIAIRIPDADIILETLHHYGKPIVGTSANFSGKADSVSMQEVIDSFGDQISLLCTSPNTTTHKRISTIVKIEENNVIILRAGALDLSDLKKVI